MTKAIALVVCLLLYTTPANNTQTKLLPASVIAALSQELSGETEAVVEYSQALEPIKVIEAVN